MKYKGIYISLFIFFFLINFSFFLEGLLGFFALPCLVAILAFFFVLVGFFCYHFYKLVKGRFQDKNRIVLTCFLALVIGFTIYKPEGLLSYELLNGESVLKAFHEGSANCTTTLNLYPNNVFTYTNICFGVYTTLGTYNISGDTIFFKDLYVNIGGDFYDHAIYSNGECIFFDKKEGFLSLYRKGNDSIPSRLCVMHKVIFK